MEITNLSHAEFETLIIRMLKEIIGYCDSIKNTKAEMKVTLMSVKEIYRNLIIFWKRSSKL